MNAPALLAIVSLIQQLTNTALALQAVSEKIKARVAAGQDVTLDDLKELQLDDDQAADVLRQAIEDAGE